MSRRRKQNSRDPRPREQYAGPVLNTGRFIEFPDGVVCEFTIPRDTVTDERWERLRDSGMVPGWIGGKA